MKIQLDWKLLNTLLVVFGLVLGLGYCTGNLRDVSASDSLTSSKNGGNMKFNPVGIHNASNYCYLSSILQVIFYIPDLRSAVVGIKPQNSVQLALASFFVRMQNVVYVNRAPLRLGSVIESISGLYPATLQSMVGKSESLIEKRSEDSKLSNPQEFISNSPNQRAQSMHQLGPEDGQPADSHGQSVHGSDQNILQDEAMMKSKKRKLNKGSRSNVKNQALDMSSDLFIAIKEHIQTASVEGNIGHFSPGQMDDVDAFWRWLVEVAFHQGIHTLITLKREDVFVSSDWRLVFTRDSAIESDVGGVIVKVLEQPGVSVHRLLTYNPEIADISFKFIKDKEGIPSGLDSNGTARHWSLDRLDSGSQEMYHSEYSIVNEQIMETKVRKISRLVGPLPPILVISAAKFAYNIDIGRSQWDSSTRTAFDLKFTLRATMPGCSKDGEVNSSSSMDVSLDETESGKQRREEGSEKSTIYDEKSYRIHAIILFSALKKHYIALVCTNVAKETWHIFDDEQVIAIPSPFVDWSRHKVSPDLLDGFEPYLFFYCQEHELVEKWIQKPRESYNPPIYTQNLISGSIFDAIQVVRQLIAENVEDGLGKGLI